MFRNNDLVYFKFEGETCQGLIKGVATSPQPVIGSLWIVKPQKPIDGFECIALPEVLLTLDENQKSSQGR